MAFNAQQTRRLQAAVVIVVLVLVIVLAVVVIAGTPVSREASSSATATADSAEATAQVEGVNASTDADASASTDGSGSLDTMEDVDATYSTAERSLQATYEADSGNPVALLNLANGYFDWGVAAMEVAQASDDADGSEEASADADHVHDLFNQAIELYDQYLADNPQSNSVIVDRAIAIFYTGDHARAIAELEQFTADNDSFAPAWANLGMFYETDGQLDNARSAYQNAVDTATDSNVKAYAQEHLDALDDSDE